VALEQRVAFLEGRVVEHSARLDGVDGSVARLERRMDARFNQVEQRIDNLDSRISRQFTWLVGLHVATLITVVGALIAR